MPIFSRTSGSLWYQIHGLKSTSTPVIGIMGLAAHADYWAPQWIQKVSSDRPFVIFDNRAIGRSTGDISNLSMPVMADDVLELMDHLKVEKAHIFGISMGGMIALTFALRHPSRLATLTLGCTTARPKKFHLNPKIIRPLFQTLIQKGSPIPILVSPTFIHQFPLETAEFARRIKQFKIPSKVFWSQIKAILNYDVLDRLSEIRVPTLVMTGGGDLIVPPMSSQTIAQGIPGSKLRVFPGSGHAFLMENQDQVAELLNQHWNFKKSASD